MIAVRNIVERVEGGNPYEGIDYFSEQKTFAATIPHGYVRKTIGLFPTLELAIAARHRVMETRKSRINEEISE